MNNQFFKLPLTMYELELSKSAIMLYAILYGNANKFRYHMAQISIMLNY